MNDFEKILPKPSCSYPTWGMLHKIWQEGAESQRILALRKIAEITMVQGDVDIILGWAEVAKKARIFKKSTSLPRQFFSSEEELLLSKMRAFKESAKLISKMEEGEGDAR